MKTVKVKNYQSVSPNYCIVDRQMTVLQKFTTKLLLIEHTRPTFNRRLRDSLRLLVNFCPTATTNNVHTHLLDRSNLC